jgi:hypothetical protein
MIAVWFITKNVLIYHTFKKYFKWIRNANSEFLNTTLVELEMKKTAKLYKVTKEMVIELKQVEIDRMACIKQIYKYYSIKYFKSFFDKVN